MDKGMTLPRLQNAIRWKIGKKHKLMAAQNLQK